MAYSVDFACTCAYWEDENFQYEQSQKTTQKESSQIGQVLDQYRQKLSER